MHTIILYETKVTIHIPWKKMKQTILFIAKLIFTYALCGGLYLLIEIFWRGRTDLTMFFLAGFLGLFAMFFNNIFSYETDYIVQVFSVSIITTFFEGLFGNLYNLDYAIWDYRNLPLSLWNDQINLIFFLFWNIIVAIAIPILDYIDWKLFKYKPDTPPYYKICEKIIFQFKG